jgi:hypothetical protein
MYYILKTPVHNNYSSYTPILIGDGLQLKVNQTSTDSTEDDYPVVIPKSG